MPKLSSKNNRQLKKPENAVNDTCIYQIGQVGACHTDLQETTNTSKVVNLLRVYNKDIFELLTGFVGLQFCNYFGITCIYDTAQKWVANRFE